MQTQQKNVVFGLVFHLLKFKKLYLDYTRWNLKKKVVSSFKETRTLAVELELS